MTRVFERSVDLPVPAAVAYDWHTRPGALERLLPPWDKVRVLERTGDLLHGRVVLEVPIGPIHQRWVSEHQGGAPGVEFADRQVEGPFQEWLHSHRFESRGRAASRLVDRVEYELPFGAVGALASGSVEERLIRTFRYRHRVLQDDLTASQLYGAVRPRTIAITGATGTLGHALIPFLTTQGHRVRRITRGQTSGDDIHWDPGAGKLEGAALEGVDAVIHLAGESIAGGRWTEERRRKILDSRIQGTTLLSETLARLRRPPSVLVSASAVGIYGNRGDEVLNESAGVRTGAGTFFVEQVAHAWEASTEPAERAGIRVVRTRIGIVLTPAGGALPPMMLPLLFGVGGRMGSGRQYMSWIAIDDVVGALYHALVTESLKGPVNLTAPTPATNAAFTETLAHILHRPAFFPVPEAAVRLLVGQMADELLLSSALVIPERLTQSGYRFRFPDLDGALRHVLGRG
ncbi:MAG TPA: TIGR01777 family oxidoreductase [Gemmatimonadales bacterium]|nr:TIGR01777 family oxidoreductase [Gemmatimonadales bacterium]